MLINTLNRYKLTIKKVFIIISLLFFIPIVAQKQKATLYFKDGTSLKGLAKFTIFGNEIKFRKEKGSERIIYDSQKIDKILIRKNDRDVMYQYKIIKNKNNPILLELIEAGKVTLYRDLKHRYSQGVPIADARGNWSSNPSGGTYYTISNYYVSKDNEDFVFHLGSKGSFFSKNFKKAASNYFKDCSVLVDKIQNKKFRKRDIVEIVEFYNENCN